LAAGQRIAIIGAAGSGKSTLLHLLAGLLPLQRGAILWDGVNLATVPTDALSCQVALLSQEPQWPRQSLARYFNLPDGRCSPETLEVLRLCGAQTVIDGRPAKLDSIVSAANFSFRERQILALARVLLQSASVLLLDEPFLDSSSRNQEALLGEIFQLKKNRTMVVAFRQPVALTLFDRIIQLQNGEIIYNGAPAAHPMAERGSQEKSA
jgi:ABC-type bacteriocin/lantibiotic exporter with double-glycine peptidase domain